MAANGQPTTGLTPGVRSSLEPFKLEVPSILPPVDAQPLAVIDWSTAEDHLMLLNRIAEALNCTRRLNCMSYN